MAILAYLSPDMRSMYPVNPSRLPVTLGVELFHLGYFHDTS